MCAADSEQQASHDGAGDPEGGQEELRSIQRTPEKVLVSTHYQKRGLDIDSVVHMDGMSDQLSVAGRVSPTGVSAVAVKSFRAPHRVGSSSRYLPPGSSLQPNHNNQSVMGPQGTTRHREPVYQSLAHTMTLDDARKVPVSIVQRCDCDDCGGREESAPRDATQMRRAQMYEELATTTTHSQLHDYSLYRPIGVKRSDQQQLSCSEALTRKHYNNRQICAAADENRNTVPAPNDASPLNSPNPSSMGDSTIASTSRTRRNRNSSQFAEQFQPVNRPTPERKARHKIWPSAAATCDGSLTETEERIRVDPQTGAASLHRASGNNNEPTNDGTTESELQRMNPNPAPPASSSTTFAQPGAAGHRVLPMSKRKRADQAREKVGRGPGTGKVYASTLYSSPNEMQMETSALLSTASAATGAGPGGMILSHSLNFPAVLYPNAPALGLVDVNYPLHMAHYERLGTTAGTLQPSGLYTIRRGAHSHAQPLAMPILPQVGRPAQLAYMPSGASSNTNPRSNAPFLVSANSETGATATASAAFSVPAGVLNSAADDAAAAARREELVKSPYYSVSYV